MEKIIHSEYLYDTDGTIIKDYALTSGAAVYCNPLKISKSNGFSNLEVTLSGGVDDVDITFDVSLDGTNFSTPLDTDGNTLGKIFTALLYATASAGVNISFGPPAMPYIRIKLDPDANCIITAKYSHVEE